MKELVEFIISHIADGIDIFLVSYLIYHIYRLFSHTRTVPVFIGLLILTTISILSRFFHLETVSWLFDQLWTYLIIAFIVILQPELRKMFYSMGQVGLLKGLFKIERVPSEEILQACISMADEKTGALIILQNEMGLREITEGGIEMNARISRELIGAVFYKGNPLHDGAMIISGNTIISSATYLPLSNSPQLKRTHGARHRAGLGISEDADSVSIIVSEEKRGKITLCYGGDLQENIDSIKLKSILTAFNSSRIDEEWQVLFKKPSLKKGKNV